MNSVFGTDGIRGKVGSYPITADFFLKLGWAVGSVLAQKGKASVVIGKDTRVSGYLFESALEAGFLSAGVDVGLLGPMPTPAIAYLTKAYSATAGVVVSASHNHFQDNGVKFFSAQGFKLSDKDQAEIEQKLTCDSMASVSGDDIGKAIRSEQPLGRYIEFCKSTFNRELDLNGLKIVIDCANGATYHIAEYVFAELGADVVVINNEPNGVNINLKCGATYLSPLQEAVIANKADLGIALDGDGDRVMMVDKYGNIIDGDDIVFIIAKAWKAANRLNNDVVVGTQMTNLGIQKSFTESGIQFIEAKVGDRFVMEKMQQHSSILGGEGSGHVICLNKTTSGDGIIAALQVLEVMVQTGNSLAELMAAVVKLVQTNINVSLAKVSTQKLQELGRVKLEIEAKLANNGRVLIRKSGTEPLMRIMVEAEDKQIADSSAQILSDILNK